MSSWIQQLCNDANVSNKRASAALSEVVLSPIVLDEELDCPPEVTFATHVEHKRTKLLRYVESIQSLLVQIQQLSSNGGSGGGPPQHCMEAVRHASYLCSKLPSSHEDESSTLFLCIARFFVLSQHTFHPSGWLHDDYLSTVPVQKFPSVDRLRLCAQYPSIWRKYVLGVVLQAKVDIQTTTSFLVTENSALQIQPEFNDRDGMSMYLQCPALHLIAMHVLQCEYVSCNDDVFANILIHLMTRLRLRLSNFLEVCSASSAALMSSSSSSSSSSAFSTSSSSSLDAYLPNGVWLSHVTTALGRKYGAPTTAKQLPAAVEALNALFVTNDNDHQQQRRNAIWLYLLSRAGHVEAALLELKHEAGSPYCTAATTFLRYANNKFEEEIRESIKSP